MAWLYMAFAGLWILVSDNLLALWVEDLHRQKRWQTGKGWLFVVVTGLLLFGFLYRYLARLGRSQARLAESEARYRQVVDGSPDAVFVRCDDHYVYANPAALRLFGASSPTELLDKPADELVHPEERAAVQARIRGVLATGAGGQPVERRLLKRDGTVFFGEVAISRMDHHGQPAVEVVVRDVTERHQAQERLRESEARYRLLFESNPHPMWVYDVETLRFLDVNEAAIIHYGYSREEFLGMTIRDIRPPEDVGALLESLQQVSEGLTRAGIWRHRKKCGDIIEVEVMAHTLQYSGRRAEVVLAHDVTAERQAQVRLADSETRLGLALEAAHQGLYDLNVRTGAMHTSPQYAAMLGFDPNGFSLTHERWVESLHPEDRDRVLAAHRACVAGDTPECRIEFRQRTADAKWKWILSVGRVVERDPTGNPLRFIGTHTDIDAQKQTEWRLRRLSRVYATLSQTNQAVAQLRSRELLFQEVCRIAVAQGNLRMAWIGLIDEKTKRVVPVASEGAAQDYLEQIHISTDPDAPEGRGPTGTALRDGQHHICNDFEHDAAMRPWREAAHRAGFGASAAFPLRQGDRVVGALNLYAAEPGFFDEAIINLLDELALDISFALDRLELEAQRAGALTELRESEERYRTLAEAAQDMIFIHDREGRVEYVNRYAAERFKCLPDQLIGRSRASLFPPVVAARQKESLEKVFTTGQPYYAETLTPFPDKSVWLSTWLAPLLDASGGVRAVLGISRDITQRKEAEEDLRERKQELSVAVGRAQQYLDVAGVVLVALDQNGCVTLLNRRGQTLLGYAVEELRGCNWFDKCVPERLRNEVRSVFEKLMAGKLEVVENFENPVLTRDGEERLMAWHNALLRDAANTIVGTLSSGEDITERRKAEERLRASEEKFFKAFHSSPDALAIVNLEDTRIVEINEGFTELFGYTADEARGHSTLELHIWKEPRVRNHLMRELAQKRSVRNLEVELQNRQRHTLTCLFSGEVLEIGGQRCLLGVARDITERKRAELAIRQLSGQLLNLQDEERRRIARELHDTTCQNLAALGMNLTRLGRKLGTPDEEVGSLLAESQQLAERSTQEIRTLSYLLHSPVLEVLGLPGALREFVQGFGTRSGLRTAFKAPANFGRLPQEVEMALFRVVQEALGNIHRHSGSPTAGVRLSRDAFEVEVEIVDAGRGIPPDKLTSLNLGLGELGVGIAGMRERLRQLGGRLEIESSPKGTTVRATVALKPPG
jgi:PAS domain S-box-containing protein